MVKKYNVYPIIYLDLVLKPAQAVLCQGGYVELDITYYQNKINFQNSKF